MCVAGISLLAGATAAKLAQYQSPDSCTRYLAKTVKMRACGCETDDVALPSAAANVVEPGFVQDRLFPREMAPVRLQVLLLPFNFRPPPGVRL